jgi:AraC-like DNA-binding protein
MARRCRGDLAGGRVHGEVIHQDQRPTTLENGANWRAALSGIFETAGSLEQLREFRGAQSHLATGRFAISCLTTTAATLLPSHERRLDFYGLLLAPAGEAAFSIGASHQELAPRNIVIFDLTQEFEIRVCPKERLAEIAILWTPRSRLQSLVTKSGYIHGASLSAKTSVGTILGETLAALFRHAPDLDPAEMDALLIGYIEMAGRSLDALLRDTTGALVNEPLTSLVSIRNFIDQNLSSPKLDVNFIAQTFGMSRVTLFRLFASLGGVATYIRQQRLERAYQQIAAPRLANQQIKLIAHKLGFRSMATFNRLFAAAYGQSPNEIRSQNVKGREQDKIAAATERNAIGKLAQILAAISPGAAIAHRNQ